MAMSKPELSATTGPKFCSQCGGPLGAGAKFCPGCGSAVGSAAASAPAAPSAAAGTPPASSSPAPPPPAAAPPQDPGYSSSPPPPPPPPPPAAAGPSGPNPYGAPPVAPSSPAGNDIRGRVDQDRGILKKLQLLIPGFRGYRQGEDIRAADSLLRIQVADRLVTAMTQIDSLRSGMARDGVMAGLVALGGLRSEFQRLEGQIRHAEGGYSGISSTIKVTPQTLDNLYQRDWTFVASGDQVLQTLASLQQAVSTKDSGQINSTCDTLRANLKALEVSFSQRMEAVEGILQ